MRRMPIVADLWPGLPKFRTSGTWPALARGLAAAGLDPAPLATFGRTELVAPDVRIAMWVILSVAWAAVVADSTVDRPQAGAKQSHEAAERLDCPMRHEGDEGRKLEIQRE